MPGRDYNLLLILFAFCPFGTSFMTVVRAIVISTIESAESFGAVEDDAEHVLSPEERDGFVDSIAGSAPRPCHEQAGVCLLLQ